MLTSPECGNKRFESNDVHELPVKESLYQYDPHVRYGFFIQRVCGSRDGNVQQGEYHVSNKNRVQIGIEHPEQQHEITYRTKHREYHLEQEHVWKRYQSERSFSEGMAVFPETLERSVTPTKTLFE